MRQEIDICKYCDRTVTIPEIANINPDGSFAHPGCILVHEILHDWQGDVQRFHELFGLPVLNRPQLITAARIEFRAELIREEVTETIDAMLLQADIVEIADGICDSIYVLLGAALEFGIDISPIWNEVQRTNMLKEGGSIREDGKILKPKDWIPPQIEKLLEEQGWES